MKLKKWLLPALLIVVGTSLSCTKLDEEVYSSIPIDKFFQSEKDVLMNAGRSYTKLQKYPEEFSIWSLTELSSDEMVAPARDDGQVWDNGRWNQLQKHQVEPGNKINASAWQFVFEGISACNEVLYETEASTIQFAGKEKILAEIRILRAYFYYIAIDNWGNVPFSTDFTNRDLPEQKNRQFIASFIIDEINSNVDKLQAEPTSEYYGRVTQGMAYTLLAKMYLNAQEWLGTNKAVEAIAACDKVIALNAYRIEDNYFTNFKVQNEVSKENIFVIPMDAIFTRDRFYWQQLTLNDASRATFDFVGQMWDEFVVEPGFLDKYSANDIRKKSFLFGQQYDKQGNPISFVEGGVTVPFIYTTTISDYMSRKRWEGARGAKYEYQPKLEYYVTEMSNDFVLFRYADVLYTKFEALWRLGRAGEMIGNPELQKIRTRAGLAPYTVADINATELLNEFAREFAWEGRRRQDQIRFGVWGDTWWNKPTSAPSKKLFPIPQVVLNANPNLQQNP
ncbi:RagB/SusD family nutrient uptake outer membrane protein [Ferruginibacter sp. HRS2-29]|uniref:RagB/SusD family nutrient uptake outer membrane protein n=1 Tax=Ferruginibacter sp. HRS2-29 TaxID=2487334 RepID=UPI0020CC8146|nr:RagB/SusD family nutrient uptake outer membrane protein [Ferruginibacter sp. HRS2-29]MCP9750968.1 RagB/SusD family nutrient uptake outer membrane protein [Ferruginibacter sp. HRS2-29]